MTFHLKASLSSSDRDNKDVILEALSSVRKNNFWIQIIQPQMRRAFIITDNLLSHSSYPTSFSSWTVSAVSSRFNTSNPPEKWDLQQSLQAGYGTSYTLTINCKILNNKLIFWNYIRFKIYIRGSKVDASRLIAWAFQFYNTNSHI